MVRILILITLALCASVAHGRISVSPYVSVKSTKSIKGAGANKETESVAQRNEAGVRAAVGFYRIFKLQLGVGQSKTTTTQKTVEAKDEYGEIDYEKDVDLNTDDPANELKITETQRNAKLSIILDPGFWIFILRAKAGVTAQQRILETEQVGREPTTLSPAPTFKPHSGFGAGVRLGRKAYFIAEYEFNHYMYPKLEPFEREVSVSFGLNF